MLIWQTNCSIREDSGWVGPFANYGTCAMAVEPPAPQGVPMGLIDEIMPKTIYMEYVRVSKNKELAPERIQTECRRAHPSNFVTG